jgi:hypothetical protein
MERTVTEIIIPVDFSQSEKVALESLNKSIGYINAATTRENKIEAIKRAMFMLKLTMPKPGRFPAPSEGLTELLNDKKNEMNQISEALNNMAMSMSPSAMPVEGSQVADMPELEDYNPADISSVGQVNKSIGFINASTTPADKIAAIKRAMTIIKLSTLRPGNHTEDYLSSVDAKKMQLQALQDVLEGTRGGKMRKYRKRGKSGKTQKKTRRATKKRGGKSCKGGKRCKSGKSLKK